MPPEGMLAPDSYEVTPGTTVQSVLDRMRAAQDAILAEVWPAPAPMTCRSRPRKRCWCWPRSSKRKPRLRMNGRLFPACWSTASGRGCGCSSTRRSSTDHPRDRVLDRPISNADIDGRTEGAPAWRDPVQHLPDRRASGRPDCQSQPRLAGGGAEPGRHGTAVLRGRRHWRACLCRDAGRAQRKRRPPAPDRGRGR